MLEDSASPSGPSSSDQPPTAVATPDPTVGSPPSEDSAPAATSPAAPLAPTNASSSSPSPASEVQQQQTSGSNPTSDSKCENSGATATGSGNNGPGSTSTSSSFPAAFQSGPLKRISLSEEELAECDADKLRTLWRDQDKYLDQLEAKFADDSVQIRDLELKARNSSHDSGRREQFLVMRLSTKEQELQELSNQIAELKSAQTPSTSQLKSSLVDPAVNIIIQRLQKELAETKKKFTETQEELGAWKFTPDSVTGKRLMSKCRQLLQENEDIGKMIASGR